jgi:flavin reductase (DIM6/NTAB) family NADH-FMN oxidoreductase RutF
MPEKPLQKLTTLDLRQPIWNRFFWVSPLAVIGSVEPDGKTDFAPKHMVTPMGWQNYFGFVCTPRHATYTNVQREGSFTVSMPRPDQVVLASLCAAPRCGGEDGEKLELESLQTRPARIVKGELLAQSYLFLECELFKIVDGFGENSLITGKIVAARIAPDSLRTLERDGQDLISQAPLLAYLPPARFASIDRTFSFPFPAGFKR